MENEYELTLSDYIDIFKRRAVVLISVFLIVISIAAMISILLPPVYESSGTILVESQQISTDIISSTVTGYAAERIQVIKQRVMTRENLLQIIEKYNLFKAKDKKMLTSELVELMRKNVHIELLSTDMARLSRGMANIAFSISFENRYPERSYKVTNELVTLFLNENIKSRVERATETTDFLEQEAIRLKADLEKIESLVASYKQENANALPEHLGLKMEILERAQNTLTELNRDYKAKEVELERLKLELTTERTRGGDGSTLSELEELKAEYKRASLLYKENHPTVRLLRQQIDALNKLSETNEQKKRKDSNIFNSVLISRLETRINTVKSELNSIEGQRKPLRKKIGEFEEQVINTPQVELGLSSLLRDHGNAKAKYEEIQAKQLTAQVAENLEGENKSERLTLIDPPLYPDKPIKPNRKKIMMLGFLLSTAVAIGIVFLLEILNQTIRGHGALTSLLGKSPLVEIPYITTDAEHVEKKMLIKKILIVIAVLFVIALISIHLFYMELDVLFYKILARF